MPSLSILLPSSGRPTLQRLVDSVVGQLADHDELIIDRGLGGCWGYPARERLTQRAQGDFLLWNDDDDVYTPDALSLVRRRIAEQPQAAHIFSMIAYWGEQLWRAEDLVVGNVAAQMLAVPRQAAREQHWGDVYEADFYFIEAVSKQIPLAWHRDVIVHCRPLHP